MTNSQILFIIPCYNEAERLSTKEFAAFFSKGSNKDVDFLFVNDGSSDDTITVLEALQCQHKQVGVLDLKKNGGKAEAIRQGMLLKTNSHYSYVGYLDADLATPLSEIQNLRDQLVKTNSPSPYLVMGSRIKLLGYSNIQRKISRHYIGRVFATIVSNMLRLPIYDTQCGAKLIQKELLATIFQTPFLSKWLFDVEMLFRIKKMDANFESKIIEVPLKHWEDKDGSKISLTYYFQAPFDLLRIYWKYK